MSNANEHPKSELKQVRILTLMNGCNLIDEELMNGCNLIERVLKTRTACFNQLSVFSSTLIFLKPATPIDAKRSLQERSTNI